MSKKHKTKHLDWIRAKRDNKLYNGFYVKCIVEIRHNKSGEVREYESDEEIETGKKHPEIFNWAEGNYRCDCNRRLFFKRANNEPEYESDFDIDCSHGKFSVNLKNKKDGKVYYREFKATEEKKKTPPLDSRRFDKIIDICQKLRSKYGFNYEEKCKKQIEKYSAEIKNKGLIKKCHDTTFAKQLCVANSLRYK